ncbi:hypothetical protein GRX03_03875 [Halovenus sp. WSH3]|uniref:Rhomboid family intramembrane serine protease n=1 Tax=Halovenus carboxidivorans TaxID=2692199 RepID=A0A6B0SYS5_9EURY|nr:hypothetical protein [Halovenus carboxidivorans]MXR50744.1 hypothetical protein [Halovenus carboxidivorans]
MSSAIDDGGFWHAVAAASHLADIAAIISIPLFLVGIFFLPPSIRESFVFETANPTVQAAYGSHFVHRQQFHLLGNLSVYLLVVPITYLLCLLGGRRQLFWITFTVLLTLFPIVLSVMQLLFPRHRSILGFSGINAGFFGFLCVAWVLYAGQRFIGSTSIRYAPAIPLLLTGVIALITLPDRAWRLEIAAASIMLGSLYVLLWITNTENLSNNRIRAGLTRFGFAELAGAGFGLLVSYPFVGFRSVVTARSGVLDVYIHLLGYSLAFIVVFVYVTVVEQ